MEQKRGDRKGPCSQSPFRNVRRNKLFKKTLPFTLSLQESWVTGPFICRRVGKEVGKETERSRRRRWW